MTVADLIRALAELPLAAMTAHVVVSSDDYQADWLLQDANQIEFLTDPEDSPLGRPVVCINVEENVRISG